MASGLIKQYNKYNKLVATPRGDYLTIMDQHVYQVDEHQLYIYVYFKTTSKLAYYANLISMPKYTSTPVLVTLYYNYFIPNTAVGAYMDANSTWLRSSVELPASEYKAWYSYIFN